MQYDTIVVGGGIGGLSAAYELLQRGANPLLLESQATVGGVMQSERTPDGFLLERGPNTVTISDPELPAHFAALGIADLKLEANHAAAKRYVLHAGQPVPIPLAPNAFLRSTLLSVPAKLRMLAELLLPATSASDESIAAFFIRRLGVEPFERLIDPFISGVYAGDPYALSMKAAFPRFWAAEQRSGSMVRGILSAPRREPRGKSAMISFRQGLMVWPQALARALGSERVWSGTRVVALRPSVAGWQLTVERGGELEELSATRVILATPAAVTADLLEHLSAVAARALRTIPYPPVNLVHLGFRRSDVRHPLDGFGLLCPNREQRKVLGILWPSTLFPGRAPVDHVLMSVFVGGARFPELTHSSDEGLLDIVQNELSELLGVQAAPVMQRIVRWPHAIPQYTAGHSERVETLRQLEATYSGLHLVANYLDGVSVERCWQRGRDLARSITPSAVAVNA